MRRLLPFLMVLLPAFVLSQKAKLGIPVGHTGFVQTLVFSPDQRMIVSGADDNRIKFWDIKTGKVIRTFYEHNSTVTDLSFNRSGDLLLSLSYDSTGIVWDVVKGEVLHQFSELPIYKKGAEFSPSGLEVAYIYKQKLLNIRQLSTNEEVTLFGHNAPISVFTFNKNQSYVASGDEYGNVLIHNPKTGENLGALRGHSSTIMDLAFSPDNTKLVSCSFDREVIVWDILTGKMIHKLKKFKDELWRVEFGNANNIILVNLDNTTEEIWDIETGKKLMKFKGQRVNKSHAHFSPAGKYLFLEGNFENAPQLLDANDFSRVHKLPFPESVMNDAVFSENDELLAISYYGHDEIFLLDCESGELIKELKGNVEAVMCAKFNENETEVVASSKFGSALIWNLKHASPSHFYNEHEEMVFETSQYNDKLITSSEDDRSIVYDIKNDKILHKFKTYGTWEIPSQYSSDGNYMVSETKDYTIEIRDAVSFEVLHRFKKDRFTEFHLCNHENLMVVYSPEQDVEVIDISSGEVDKVLPNYGIVPNEAMISGDGKYVVVRYAPEWDKSRIRIWDLDKNEIVDSLDFVDRFYWMNLDVDGKNLIFSEDNEVATIYNLETRAITHQLTGHKHGVMGAEFSPDGKRVCTISGDNSVNLYDLSSGELISSLDKHKNGLRYVSYGHTGEYIVTASWDGSFVLWDGKTGEFLQQYYFFQNDPNNFMVLDDEGYYVASKKATQEIYYTIENSIYPLEQFDLKYNRPDLVLSRFKGADPALIQAYYKAYQKRLKKMGFTEGMLRDDIHIPEVEIQGFESMPDLIEEGYIDLNLKLNDSKYLLDRINIWVNDVAVDGVDGISLRSDSVRATIEIVRVQLAKGLNKVQVSVLNQVGAESLKETFEITTTSGKSKPDLYLLSIGAGKFEQSSFNLKYASKDAEDVVSLLSNSQVYGEIYTKVLLDDQVTLQTIREAKTFLEKAQIDDQVIIFFAGHGVLDENLDYYFASHAMDFNDPQEAGIPYEELENLMNGIRSLKKVMLIDACHSGEIDKEEVELANAQATHHEDVQFRSVGNDITPKLGVENTSELSAALFTDLRKGTGATVISSAGGMEFAMEGEFWKNGLFTYCFINGINSMSADLNGDNEIWLSEIQQYVSEQVVILSKGLQQPTSRIENQTVDFRIW